MKEGLVNKLQASLSKFRNDRDQLHRSKELALERCRLIEEEVTVLSKTVDSLRQKHGQLQATRQSIEGDLGAIGNHGTERHQRGTYSSTKIAGEGLFGNKNSYRSISLFLLLLRT